MDYDYNNILGRLKFDLGQDSFFFRRHSSQKDRHYLVNKI